MKISYRKRNQLTYDTLAKEYKRRIPSKEIPAIETADFISRYITRFNIKNVLECGPGNGNFAKELINKGMNVTAIDISKKMGEIASKNAKDLNLLIGDFLDYDFGNNKFDLVVGRMFIHLFKTKDAITILQKMNSLLNKNGIIFLTTTVHNEYKEGFEKKENYPDAPARYRVRYTGEKLKELVSIANLEILEYSELYRDIITVSDVIGTLRIVLGNTSLIPPHKELLEHIKE
jgi:SAM-dependent methyltransferase